MDTVGPLLSMLFVSTEALLVITLPQLQGCSSLLANLPSFPRVPDEFFHSTMLLRSPSGSSAIVNSSQ